MDTDTSKCHLCGEPTKVIVPIRDVPRNISPTGEVKMPYCHECYVKMLQKRGTGTKPS